MPAIIPDTLQGALILSVIDFFASFVIISGIGVVLALFPWFARRGFRRRQVAPAAAPPRPTVTAPAVAEGVADEHLAVIAAAVYATLSGTHRIVRIEPTHGGEVWVAEGRLAHHSSHLRPSSR